MNKNTIYSLGFIIILTLTGIFSVGAASRFTASNVVIQTADNLQQMGQLSRERKLPLLLVFVADDCAYCELLEAEILKPMLISGDYEDRVIIAQMNIDDSDTELRDFDGSTTTVYDVSARYGIYVTPTMIFIDGNGNELDEKILGINTISMFGGRVDSAIDISLSKLRGAKKIARSTAKK